jgi:hypothetical protein
VSEGTEDFVGELFWRKSWSQATFEFASAAKHRRFRQARKQQTSFPPHPLQKTFGKREDIFLDFSASIGGGGRENMPPQPKVAQ